MAGQQLMKAVQYSEYGGGAASLKHVEIPVPVPKKGEILVKVQAASINPVDWKINKGYLRPIVPAKFPYVPGSDITGEVVSVGAGVKEFAPGDKILSWLDIRLGGSLAEYAVAVPRLSAKRPPALSVDEAAGLPCSGVTALQSLTNSGINIDGSYTGNVLIIAASSAVGLFAVQLAKLSGAHVTATVGERNIELIKSLGADEVLDYKSPEGIKLISPSGKKYDVVVNTVGLSWSTIQPQLTPTGIVQDPNPNLSKFASALLHKLALSKQKKVNLLGSINDKDLNFLVDLVVAGKLKLFTDSKFPLERVEEAWAKSIEGHPTGKIVVTIAEE